MLICYTVSANSRWHAILISGKEFPRNYSFKHKDTKKQSIFLAYGRYYEQQSCLQSPQSFPQQAFVATFSRLLSLYLKKIFVSLCICVLIYRISWRVTFPPRERLKNENFVSTPPKRLNNFKTERVSSKRFCRFKNSH